MSSLKQLAISGSIIYWLGKNLVFLFTFLGNLILARLIIPESYGLIAIANSINDIVLVFTSVGLNLAVINLFNENKVKESCLFLAWFLFFILCFFSIFIYYILLKNNLISYDIFLILMIIAPITCLQLPSSVYLGVYESELKFKISVLIWSIGPILGMIFGIFFAYYDFQEWSLVIKQVITTSSVFLILFIVSNVRFSINYDLTTLIKILRYSIYIFFQRLTEIPFKVIPVFFLSNFTNKSIVGYFDRSYYLVDIQTSTLSPFYSNVFFSILSKKKDNYQKINLAYKDVFFYISRLTLLSSLVIYFYPDIIIDILLGDKWLQMENYLKGLFFLFLILPLFNLKIYTLLSISKTNLLIISNLVCLIFLLVFISCIYFGNLPNYYVTYSISFVFIINLIFLEIFYNQLNFKEISNYIFEYLIYFLLFYFLQELLNNSYQIMFLSIFLVLIIYLKDIKKFNYIFSLLKK